MGVGRSRPTGTSQRVIGRLPRGLRLRRQSQSEQWGASPHRSSVLLLRDVDLVVARFEVGEVCLDGRDVALRNENDPVAIGHVEDTT